MNWKDILTTVIIVMVGIYLFKWVNKQYPIPVLGAVIDEI